MVLPLEGCDEDYNKVIKPFILPCNEISTSIIALTNNYYYVDFITDIFLNMVGSL